MTRNGGVTAALVAVARAVATGRGLINDPFAASLVRAFGVDVLTRVAEDEADVPDLHKSGEDAAFAWATDLFAARTRYFDDFVADAGIAGVRQVVILASGLDARAYRLWWPAGTTVYEVDQPHVLEFKTRTLRKLGATAPVNRRVVGIDLRQDWAAALQHIGFDAARPSAWIAEGLLVGFLPPDAQDRLLDNVTALSAPDSRLAADYMPGVGQAHHEQVLADRVCAYGLDLDLTELTFSGERADVADHLATSGWQTSRATTAEVFAAAGLSRPPFKDSSATVRYLCAVRQ